jgi:hypothetical protein
MSGNDRANDIVIDGSNNIFVVGYHSAAAGETNWLTKKSTDGQIWADADNYTVGDNAENAICVNVDSNNKIYVAGTEVVGSQGKDWIVRRSTNNGTTWATVDHYNNSANVDDEPGDIAIDSNNIVYVGGYGANDWVIRYSKTGNSRIVGYF